MIRRVARATSRSSRARTSRTRVDADGAERSPSSADRSLVDASSATPRLEVGIAVLSIQSRD